MAETKSDLKKPIAIYILATMFLVAPFGNLLTSLIMQQIPNWTDPVILVEVLKTVPPWDWFWLGLVFVSGLALLKAHKLSWTFAIITLLFVLFMNIYKAIFPGPIVMTGMVKTQISLSILLTFAVLLIAFYFRYPYLDRRTTWFSTSKRLNVQMPAAISDSSVSLGGVLENLSLTGARVRLDQAAAVSWTEGHEVSLKLLDIEGLSIKAEIVALTEGHTVRMKFQSLDRSTRRKLNDYMFEQKNKMMT
jgi:hypothetical protein